MSSPFVTARVSSARAANQRALPWMIFFALSALYFADTLLRASLKTFWYDEIISVLLCRLPSLPTTWSAVLAGADFNPPLFYALTWPCQHWFGEGLIASRLPSIFGFWVFALCLYHVVSVRLGKVGGLVAALFPVFTLAHVYAYEARPPALVLGWCGLMLLSWQRSRDTRALWWTLALAISTLAALFTHVYVVYLLVPFFAVELLGFATRWRGRPDILAALAVPCVAAVPLYLRLKRNYESVTSIGGIHVHPYEAVQQYFVAVLSPALVVLLVAVLCLGLRRGAAATTAERPHPVGLTSQEIALAVGLGCLPVLGVIGVKLSNGPFFSRYFLAGTAGYAMLLAQAVARAARRTSAALGVATAMIALLCADTAIAAFCRWDHKDLDQVEPASRFHFPQNPREPLSRNQALLANHSSAPVLVPNDHTYLYLYYYAPPELRDRLVLAIPPNNQFSVASYNRNAGLLQQPDMRTVLLPEFLRDHSDLFVYNAQDAQENGACYDCLEAVLRSGLTLRSVDRDRDNLLEHFSR